MRNNQLLCLISGLVVTFITLNVKCENDSLIVGKNAIKAALQDSPFEHIFGSVNNFDDLQNKVTNVTLNHFQKFAAFYNKTYANSQDFKMRFELFSKRVKRIAESKVEYLTGKSSYMLAINDLVDRTNQDLHLIPLQESHLYKKNSNYTIKDEKIDDLFDDLLNEDQLIVDWRKSGCVSQVKHQGHCGSCYAFAAATIIETMRCLNHEKTSWTGSSLVKISTQHMLDCLRTRLNETGCNGGYESTLLENFAAKRYMITEDCYEYASYNGKDNFQCQEEMILTNASKNSYCVVNLAKQSYRIMRVDFKSISEMLTHLKYKGPLAAGIFASDEFTYWKQGIFNQKPSVSSTNHAVAIVGAGKLEGIKYWIVKNSWGARWGYEGGYIRVAFGSLYIEEFATGLEYVIS